MKFKLPTLHPIRLQPQPIEDDNEGGAGNSISHDNKWDLTEFTDGAALERFWEEVIQDTKAR
jgi:hypothetical protein